MTSFSGRFVLRVSQDLHQRLNARSRSEGVSLNTLCVRLLEAGLSTSGRGPVAAVGDLDPGLLEAIEQEWSADLVGIALFGSAARGRATATSDIDLLIVLESAAAIERSLYSRWDRLARSRGRRSDERAAPQFVALPRSPDDAGGIWLEVAREGIVLIDRNGRLARFLIDLRDFIAGGAVVRRAVHGHPYWIREPRRT